MYLPVAHGEGKFVADDRILSTLDIAVYYTDEKGNTSMKYPDNPNGSLNSIAGICDSSGHIFGLMPHPERHIKIASTRDGQEKMVKNRVMGSKYSKMRLAG